MIERGDQTCHRQDLSWWHLGSSRHASRWPCAEKRSILALLHHHCFGDQIAFRDEFELMDHSTKNQGEWPAS
jgi:hypothetical protein